MTLERETILERRLDRAKREIEHLESMIEDKTRSLFLAQEELNGTVKFLSSVLETVESGVIVLDLDGGIVRINRAGLGLLGYPSIEQARGERFASQVEFGEGRESLPLTELMEQQVEVTLQSTTGQRKQALCHGSNLESEGGVGAGYVVVVTDIDDRKQLELDLRHAQKLESVGQLAAGVAHEINTPVQFVGDSLTFLSEALVDFQAVRKTECAALEVALAAGVAQDEIRAVNEIAEEVDLDFIVEELPGAVARAQDGIERVATIVRAMKEFAHPGAEEKAPVNLNRTVETTITMATAEFKYVADVRTNLGELPDVMCIVGDINQVLLNLIVNAAHAIEERLKTQPEPRGLIEVATRVDEGRVLIEIRDNGTGVPAEVQAKVFDPFFTTKEVGKGTGQGLALAHRIIVERHAGELRLSSPEEGGAVFSIWLPLTATPSRDVA